MIVRKLFDGVFSFELGPADVQLKSPVNPVIRFLELSKQFQAASRGSKLPGNSQPTDPLSA